MKTIALIDTRLEIPGKTLWILVSSHDTVTEAFAANDASQKAARPPVVTSGLKSPR